MNFKHSGVDFGGALDRRQWDIIRAFLMVTEVSLIKGTDCEKNHEGKHSMHEKVMDSSRFPSLLNMDLGEKSKITLFLD